MNDHPELSDPSSSSPPSDLVKLSQRFALSLFPVLLRAKGPGIDLLVRSKVATYLQFGLLGGVGLWKSSQEAAEGKGKGKVERVPASKADVFNDQILSLVEKRRLTKLLLFAAGQDSFEEDKVLVAGAISFCFSPFRAMSNIRSSRSRDRIRRLSQEGVQSQRPSCRFSRLRSSPMFDSLRYELSFRVRSCDPMLTLIPN